MAWRGFGCDISQHGVSQPYGKGETGLDRLQLVSGFYIETGLDPITLQAMPCTGGGACTTTDAVHVHTMCSQCAYNVHTMCVQCAVLCMQCASNVRLMYV